MAAHPIRGGRPVASMTEMSQPAIAATALESELPGPYEVGRYAARLKQKLLEFARVQLVGEVWGFRSSRARVYFELRDARGALPCSMWLSDFERLGVRLSDGHQGGRRRRLRLLPGQRLLLAVVHLRGDRAAGRR